MNSLTWVNVRQAHVATCYVYLPDDPRKLRFRLCRLFSRKAGSDHRVRGYLLMLEDPTHPSSRVDRLNDEAVQCFRATNFEVAKAEAERMVQCGEVLLASSCQRSLG